MKNKFITSFVTLLAAASLQAATIVETYDEGKDKAGDDGFVVVVYPSGWNAKNEALGKAILASPELSQAAGNAVMMGMGLPNTSTKEMNEGRKKRIGKLQLPNAGSYPAIYLCEKEGRNYAIINADTFRNSSLSRDAMTKEAVAKVSKEVAARLAAIKKQRELMTKAQAASGKDALDLIHKACSIPGISRPDKVVDLVKKIDPKGESGLEEALTHNQYGFIEGCGNANGENWEAKIAEVDKKLKNPYFSNEVKQTLCTSGFGLLRRHGGAANREKMFGYLETMKKLDPKSIYGRSYVGAMRLWDSWATPWSPDLIPAANGTPMEFSVPCIKKPGTYTVTFGFSRGKHAFTASSVELWDGDTKVAEDVHNCFAGNRHTDNVYTLKVSKKVSKPVLRINTTMGNSRDSNGTITIMQE